jgi:MFS family permease
MAEPDRSAAPDIRRVLAAEAVSVFGSMLSRLAIPWAAALLLMATPWQMGWLRVAEVLAAVAGSLLLGHWVDRWRQRAVMVASDLLCAAVLALLALLTAVGWLTFGALLAAAAATGVLRMAFELARSAWLAQRVPAEQLATRNAQLSMTASLAETAAFALGGWLFQAGGALVALAADAVSFAVSALCLRGVAEPATPPSPAPAAAGRLRRHWQDGTAGLRAIAAQPGLRALAGIEVLLALSMSLSSTSYMIFVTRDLAFPTGWLGMIFACGGLGAVAGAAVAPALGRRFGAGRAMALGLAAFALGAAFIPLVPAAGLAGAALLVAHQIVGDAGHTLHDVHDRTWRQTAVPAPLLARTDAGLRLAGQVASLFGALAGGAGATVLGTRPALWLAAVLAAAASLLALLALVPRRVARVGRPQQ